MKTILFTFFILLILICSCKDERKDLLQVQVRPSEKLLEGSLINKTKLKNPSLPIRSIISDLMVYDISKIYKGEEFKEGLTSYRKDGSILYGVESQAYKRIWEMTLLTGIEEMAIIGSKTVLVLPSYFSKDSNAPFFEYGYGAMKGNVVDNISKLPFSTIALIHIHPNGSGPSGKNGDGSFMAAHFPFKPNYVMMIKKDNLDQSSISFIVGSENPYNNENGYSGYAVYDLDKNLTITNLIKQSKGYLLKDFTIQNVMNFKLLIPKFKSKSK